MTWCSLKIKGPILSRSIIWFSLLVEFTIKAISVGLQSSHSECLKRESPLSVARFNYRLRSFTWKLTEGNTQSPLDKTSKWPNSASCTEGTRRPHKSGSLVCVPLEDLKHLHARLPICFGSLNENLLAMQKEVNPFILCSCQIKTMATQMGSNRQNRSEQNLQL